MTTPVPAETRREIVQWDVPTWWRPVAYFGEVIEANGLRGANVLEVGARDGGTALYLAKFHDMHVVATDIDPVSERGRQLHVKHGVTANIEYDVADATDLHFADGSFDVVVTKSVLGGISGALGAGAMRTSIREMARVLRPGGHLLFAENLSGSAVHRQARKVRAWHNAWHYPTYRTLEESFSEVGRLSMHATGCAAVLVPERLARTKQTVALIDNGLQKLIPNRWCYVGYGDVLKPAGFAYSGGHTC
jgi:SAM-dependent methyltransferase